VRRSAEECGGARRRDDLRRSASSERPREKCVEVASLSGGASGDGLAEACGGVTTCGETRRVSGLERSASGDGLAEACGGVTTCGEVRRVSVEVASLSGSASDDGLAAKWLAGVRRSDDVRGGASAACVPA